MSNGDGYHLETYTDGANVAPAWGEITAALVRTWQADYWALGPIVLDEPRDLKLDRVMEALPDRSRAAARIRNPDLLFRAMPGSIELGGVEITAHSPDGSNIEKRYPFLWAARRTGIAGIVATPYQKHRPGGAINRLPHRAARRNERFAEDWDVSDSKSPLTQILPLLSLQDRRDELPATVRARLWGWNEVGALMAHRLVIAGGEDADAVAAATASLRKLRQQLLALHAACMALTRPTNASTLRVEETRIIQTYNARPESGHWERGEGQFDSIDGRLMVTLDDLELFHPELSGRPLEFWLPQLARGHPWIAEQLTRGYQSKRLRNIIVNLQEWVTTRFADDLATDDWLVLQQHPGLCLERDDRWIPDVYRVIDAVEHQDRAEVASVGLSKVPPNMQRAILDLLGDPTLFYGSFRAYKSGWEHDLRSAAEKVPAGGTLLLPRLPTSLISGVESTAALKGAEACTRVELMALRQLHRSSKARVRAWVP